LNGKAGKGDFGSGGRNSESAGGSEASNRHPGLYRRGRRGIRSLQSDKKADEAPRPRCRSRGVRGRVVKGKAPSEMEAQSGSALEATSELKPPVSTGIFPG